MNDTKKFWNLFKRHRDKELSAVGKEKERALQTQLGKLVRNGIAFEFDKGKVLPRQSKFGGRPSLPTSWQWPRYTNEYGEEQFLPFLLQINCEELAPCDTDNLLPHEGMFYLFYDLVNQPWLNGPGAQLLYTPTPAVELTPAEYPDGLADTQRLHEMGVNFSNYPSIPDWDDYNSLLGGDDNASNYTDWDIIEPQLESWGYPTVESDGRLLGYARLIQNGIAELCESRARGDKPESYSPESAREWILLLQLDSVDEPEIEVPFGDCGSLYFYIRQSDLKRRDFSHIQFEMQCY